MEYFYGGGGNPNPDFVYRFVVKDIPPDMYKWCSDYPLTGPFERWHIKHSYKEVLDAAGTREQTPLIQFESKKAAKMFRIAFSEYIIENKSLYSLDT